MKPASASREQFERLAMPLLDALFNFARWLTHDPTEAEDLVQETFAKALRGFDSFAPGTDFRAWMFRILRNTFLTSRAGLKATVPIEDEDEPVASAEQTPESVFIASANRALVQSAIEELPVKYREIILLCEVEEMSYQEIAQTLGVPIGIVMSRLSRARAALKTVIREKLGGVKRG